MNEPEIKMLSLWQPWASLCIWRNPDGNAEKRVETRHWQTPYRGLLAIHATASWNMDAAFAYTTTPIFRETLMRHGVQSPKHELIFGAILGVVELYDIKPTGTILDYAIREQFFGDYGEGRFGWLLRNPIEFDEPIYCRGLQSLGAPKPEIRQQILERLKFKGETMTTKKSKLALVEDLPAETTDQRHQRPFTEDEATVAFQYRKNGWIIWKDENFSFGCEKHMPDGTIKCVVDKDTIDEVTDWIDLIEAAVNGAAEIVNENDTQSVDDAFASELADLYADPPPPETVILKVSSDDLEILKSVDRSNRGSWDNWTGDGNKIILATATIGGVKYFTCGDFDEDLLIGFELLSVDDPIFNEAIDRPRGPYDGEMIDLQVDGQYVETFRIFGPQITFVEEMPAAELSPEDEAIKFFEDLDWDVEFLDNTFWQATKLFDGEPEPVLFSGYLDLRSICHDMDAAEASRGMIDIGSSNLRIFQADAPENESEPEPKPDRPNIIRKNLRVQLTAHEVAIKNTSYHETIDEIDGEKNLLIATKRKAEAKIKELEARASELRQAAISGSEHRDVMCKEVFDWDSGTVEVYRLDADTLVDARPISERERQQKFSF